MTCEIWTLETSRFKTMFLRGSSSSSAFRFLSLGLILEAKGMPFGPALAGCLVFVTGDPLGWAGGVRGWPVLLPIELRTELRN